VLAACKDSTPPKDPNAIANVFVGAQVDSATLHDQGVFILSLVPVNGKGDVITDEITVTPAVTGSSSAVALTEQPRVVAPDPRPVAAAVNLDNSGSMIQNDPRNQRITAARRFWTALLQSDSRSQVALLGFGVANPSPGFVHTRLWQDWTSDPTLLNDVLDTLSTSTLGDSTPLYQSNTEVMRWIDSTRSSNDRKFLMLFTDALPQDSALEPDLIAAAQQTGITLFTVGIGPASDQSSNQNADAIARLHRLADASSGIYAGAPSAGSLPLVFEALATVLTKGALLATVRLDPVPPPGTVVQGTVSVANRFGGATGTWTVTIQ
jgi:hypothetical protein